MLIIVVEIVVLVDCSVVRFNCRLALSVSPVVKVTDGELRGVRVGLGVDDRLKSQAQELDRGMVAS